MSQPSYGTGPLFYRNIKFVSSAQCFHLGLDFGTILAYLFFRNYLGNSGIMSEAGSEAMGLAILQRCSAVAVLMGLVFGGACFGDGVQERGT
jgi:hypothetical protein